MLSENSSSLQSSKKILWAWSMYDWANSAFPLVIGSTIFPIYYESITAGGGSDRVSFLGFSFVNTVLYSYTLSVSFLFIALLSPILSGIADYSGRKKQFMAFFCLLGSLACMSLFFFRSDTLWIGLSGLSLATIGFSGSLVFYNAYLPEIAKPFEQDRLSARGFALGYTGSSLLLIFCLTMVLKPEIYGISESTLPARIAFFLTGLWWLGFSFIPLFYLPSKQHRPDHQNQYFSKGYQELKKVFLQLRGLPVLKKYLFAFFIYNMAVQTVMNMAAIFGAKELKLESSQLIITILIIQFVAIGGAYLFSYLSFKAGNIKALGVGLFFWALICILAYFVYTPVQFYGIAFCVGMVMGGIQALSRSTYSKMLPPSGDHASYFSFYDVCDKLGYFFGIGLFGMIESFTGTMRNSILSLFVLFVLGMVLLRKVDYKNSTIPAA